MEPPRSQPEKLERQARLKEKRKAARKRYLDLLENMVPRLFFNWLSVMGFFFVSFGIIGEVFIFLMDLFSPYSPSYQGLIYLLFFVLIAIGLSIMVFGVAREHFRLKRGLPPSASASILADRPIFVVLSVMILMGGMTLVVGFSSYSIYQVTESPEFCGQTCHSVMHPEWNTYQTSPHAKVPCVKCHIGSGAEWYVRSKLSGLRQIYAVFDESYSRPISTPIHHLRPARETCEECHWRKKFMGYQDFTRTYTLKDEENTPFHFRMLLHIGGEKTAVGKGSGIHYHMLIANKVEYIARDKKRQNIAWVRTTKSDGSTSVYNNIEEPLTEKEKKTLKPRKMDCVDCHNRAAHQFPTATKSVNEAIEENLIPRVFPSIKVQAVKVLSQEYANVTDAEKKIAISLQDYYQKNYPEFLKNHPDDLVATIKGVQSIYKRIVFPEMKSNWFAYPDNIGHLDWPGCFRCHNDYLENEDGDIIFKDCNSCHIILAQGEDSNEININFKKGLEFMHPGIEEPMEEFSNCAECHTGGDKMYNR
ncbi:MAG: NapC/NirT family cytochrome c [SAR324 cluster bacterium]|nr:NapC/NirT family cytochrome c [SAR324 cluster bacterium]